MNDSILTSIKKLLGIVEDYEHFDPDIVMHINTVLMILNQIGVGPPEGLLITDKTTTWKDFIGDAKNLGSLQSYVYLKVRLLFDPPTTSAVMEAANKLLSELEWRLSVTVETTITTEEVEPYV